MRKSVDWIVLLVSIILAGQCYSQEEGISVSVDVSVSVAHPGDDVTVVCRVQGMQNPFYVLHWVKSITGADGNEINELISTNDVVVLPYDATGRYNPVPPTVAGDVHIWVLQIIRVTEEDNGEIACVIPKHEDVMGRGLVKVYDQVDHISFSGYDNEGTLSVQLGTPIALECTATGAVPPPVMQVTVGSVDYTDKFITTQDKEILCDGSISSKDCLLHYTYHITVRSDTFTPTIDDDEGILTCKASVEGSGFDDVITNLHLNVLYPPIVTCDPNRVVKLHTENVLLTCTLEANPSNLDEVYWEFQTGTDSTLVRIKPGEITVGSEYMAEQTVEGTTVTVNLQIKEIMEYHFINYKLVARNSEGDADPHFITIKQELSEGPNPGASSSSSRLKTLTAVWSIIVLVTGLLISACNIGI